MEAAVEGGVGNWGEVVTRYPYRKVRMDHLLSKEKWNRKISYPMVDHLVLPVRFNKIKTDQRQKKKQENSFYFFCPRNPLSGSCERQRVL
jgi:hypothetical protein